MLSESHASAGRWHASGYVPRMAASKNSLVANINRRKKKGTSRPKSKSTVSRASYQAMEDGWPKRAGKKVAKKTTKKGSTKTRKKSPKSS